MMNIIRTREILHELDDELTREQSKIVRRKNTPLIEIIFGETKAKALVDTGAQISAITKETFDKLRDSKVKMEILPINKILLIGGLILRTWYRDREQNQTDVQLQQRIVRTYVLHHRENGIQNRSGNGLSDKI